jgi:hypothetical protein
MKRAMALYGLGSVFKGDDASPTLQSMMMMDMARSKKAQEDAEQERIQNEISSIWRSPMAQSVSTPAKNSYGLDMGRSSMPKGNTTTVGGKTYDMGREVGSDYASAISSVESGGRYDAIGPVTKDGNRAYGKYQVMDFNIGPWTEKHLGRRMTPQEFLASPDAQDAVFEAEFGSYVSKYGNPQDAASAWFSGRPMAQAGNSSDGYTTVPEYVAKFSAALDQPTVSTSGRPAQSADFSFGNVTGQQFQGALVPQLQQRESQRRQQPVRLAQNGTDWRALAMRIRNSNLPPEEKQRQFQQLRTMMQIEQANQPPERKTMQDATGRARYLDTGEYVFPDVEVPVDQPSSVKEYEYARQNGYQGTYNDFLNAKGKANATNVTTNLNTGELSPGWEAVDKAFADKYLEYKTQGISDTRNQAAQIATVLGKFESGEDLTGPMYGYTPDFLKVLTNPEAADAQARVESVIQRSLRETLGAQFTEKEGERLISRAYDPKQPPEANAARLRALFKQIESAADAKAAQVQYFEENGTLRGYKGPEMPGLNDFYSALEGVGRSPISASDIRSMSPDDIIGADLTQMDSAAQAAWSKRMDELGY